MSQLNERQLAGWLFCETEQALRLMNEHRVTDVHLEDTLCRNIYLSAVAFKKTGKTADHWLVMQEAKRIGLDIDAKEWQRCADEAVVVPGQLEPHLSSIKSEHIGRMAILAMRDGALKLKNGDDSTLVLHEVQRSLADLQCESTSVSNSVHHITDHRASTVERWRTAVDCGFVGIPSSLPEVDRALGGYRRKVMCILGGYRGEGKSLFMRQEMYSASCKGFKSLLICLEDPEDMAAAIIAGHKSGRSVFSLDIGHASDNHIMQIDDEWAGMANLPLWTASARSIDDIVAICLSHKAKYGLDFVGIDHIQYISPYQRKGMDRNGTIAMYSNTICGLLKDVDSAGLVASQFSRNAERDNRRPRLSDLRDSGTIEQDCRQALLLSRDANGHVLEVAKNNFGPSGVEIPLERIGSQHKFVVRKVYCSETNSLQ